MNNCDDWKNSKNYILCQHFSFDVYRDKILNMFEKEAERKILEAIAKGELDNYKGKGKPLPDEFWDEGNPLVPDELKQIYKILKNASILPEEITLKKELEELRDQFIKAADNSDERARLSKLISMKETEFNIKLDAIKAMTKKK